MKKRLLFLLAFTALCVVAMSTGVLAADSTMPDMTAAFTAGMTQLENSFYAIVAVIIPTVIAVLGARIVIMKGLGWFKSLTGKGM